MSHVQFKGGDLEAGFAQADFVVEREFETRMVHQGYIEPHNAVAMLQSPTATRRFTPRPSPRLRRAS